MCLRIKLILFLSEVISFKVDEILFSFFVSECHGQTAFSSVCIGVYINR